MWRVWWLLIPVMAWGGMVDSTSMRIYFDAAYEEGLENAPMPPAGGGSFAYHLGVIPFESNGFTMDPAWSSVPMQGNVSGYKLTFTETQSTNERIRCVRDETGLLIDCWTNNWDAFGWAEDHYGEMDAADDPIAWLNERDPSRLQLRVTLVEDGQPFMDWQLAVLTQVSTQQQENIFPYYDPSWSNDLVILGLDHIGDAWIHCPSTMDEYELFACSDLCSNDWQLLQRGTVENDPHIIDLDYSVPQRFYVVGNALLDTDFDHLSDASEQILYGTSHLHADTDGDGLYDGEEIISLSDPLLHDDTSLLAVAGSGTSNASAVTISLDDVDIEYKSWEASRTKFKDFAAFTETVPPVYYLNCMWGYNKNSSNEVSSTDLRTGTATGLGSCSVDGRTTKLNGHSAYLANNFKNGEFSSLYSETITWNNSTATETIHDWMTNICNDTSTDSYCGFKGGAPVGLPGPGWNTFIIRPYLYWGGYSNVGAGSLTENYSETSLQSLRNKYTKQKLIYWTEKDLSDVQKTFDPGWGTNVAWEVDGTIDCDPLAPEFSTAWQVSSRCLTLDEDVFKLDSPAFRFKVDTIAGVEYVIYWMEKFYDAEDFFWTGGTGTIVRVHSKQFTGTGGEQYVGWPDDPDQFRIKPPTAAMSNGIIAIIPMVADLDIDADNNDTIDDADDPIEDHPDHSGKIVMVNDDDSDADGIPDFLDGYGNDPTNSLSNSCSSDSFTQITLSLPEPIDLSLSRLQFVYDAAQPGETNQALRIWSVDAPTDRNPEPILKAGHYVDEGIYSDLSVLGFSGSTRTVTFYVEGIQPGTHRIAVLLDPDGPGDAKLGEIDAIKITCISVNLESLDFTGAGNHTLRKDGIDSWENDSFSDSGSVLINYPEWIDTNSDRQPEIAEPVCYTQCSQPKMNISTLNSIPADVEVLAELKIFYNSNQISSTNIILSGSQSFVNDIEWAATNRLPIGITASDCTLVWKLKLFESSPDYILALTTNDLIQTLDTPITINSFGQENNLTCLRVYASATVAEAAVTNVSLAASKMQYWRDNYGIDNSGSTASTGDKVWGLLDLTEKGQCAEGSMLMEQAMRLLGIDAEYQHVLAATSLPVATFSASSQGTSPAREHDSTTETLCLYFDLGSNNPFNGWNLGEGCCLVGGKLYSTWAGGVIGKEGGVVDGVSANSAAHHILLQLEHSNPFLQRWRKADGTPCDNGDTEPVPKS